MTPIPSTRLPPGAVRKAVRLTFVQTMTGAVYAASTGGMFLIGYALRLGADNVAIGLMSTIPMLCVMAQILSAAWVERGVSRRRLTAGAALLNAAGWSLILMIPFLVPDAAPAVKVGLLIGILAVVTVFANAAGNARASWVGDLIPERFRGTFFGRTAMYGGIVAAAFAVMEGAFLDRVKAGGLTAFSVLFGFGMVFGLVTAALFLPQADPPLTRHERPTPLRHMIRQTLSNRDLRRVVLFTSIWALQMVAAPFYPTYMLRDLRMSFVGVGLMNATFMVAFLVTGPFWGRVVDRHGCRPVLVACSFILGPLQGAWAGLSDARVVYAVLPFVNLVAGTVVSGVNVALNTLVYKVTPKAGRSVQLALYSIAVTVLAAPLPTLGGHLPGWLEGLGLPSDLRSTFYVAGILTLVSCLAARRIREPGARSARDMLRDLHGVWIAPLLPWRE